MQRHIARFQYRFVWGNFPIILTCKVQYFDIYIEKKISESK